MQKKIFLIIIVVGLLTFAAGWFLRSAKLLVNQGKERPVRDVLADSLSKMDTGKRNEFSKSMSGRFVLAESNCAGLYFITKDTVLWTNEIACNDPDTLILRWLNDSIFMTKATLRTNEKCPPRVDIYKVISFDGRHLTLRSVWTGWNALKDEILELTRYPR